VWGCGCVGVSVGCECGGTVGCGVCVSECVGFWGGVPACGAGFGVLCMQEGVEWVEAEAWVHGGKGVMLRVHEVWVVFWIAVLPIVVCSVAVSLCS